MNNFESALNIISKLVEDFKSNELHYTNPSYSEADVRNDFIKKFFIALGWDVRHEIQKNPYEQEVRVEKPVQIAKAQKRADYSFSIAPNYRTVKFFVEAKKPARELENKDYYFQTARYGWNANTPIAVLTDFEEFHIIDCRFKPDINEALNYKIKKFHYSEYAEEEKFAEIYWLFSREAVANGSIEKYAESLPKPRGKKLKTIKEVSKSIDESFLEELDEIRKDLAKSFKKNNSHLSSEELTEATQRTIDRLVFIKFLEDKLIEPNHYVSEFGKRRKAWEDFLITSRTLDAKYNGVVFKKSSIDSRNIFEPDDKIFSAICEKLSHENTPYNFDAIPIHILGSIYERFLGKVVNATEKRVTIEEKPEVRKAGGVYYTPQYIVNYIVDNTVGKLIEGKTPKEIAKMRFADIACGSGSFLITVFERLLDYHKRWYIENPEQAKKDGCILVEGTYRLSLKQKTKILLNNIYGVDIDQQAVEVTQLSLYLKLLEDETTATANDTWVMFKEQLLPNLNKNILCGNSLIGTDILQNELFDFEQERKLKPMDFETVFPEVMSSGGFDAIVGNPPWISLTGRFRNDILSEKEIEYLIKKYLGNTYMPNIYEYFVSKSLALISSNGLVSLIVPDRLGYNKQFIELRKRILNNFRIIELLYKAPFPNIVTDTLIFIIKNELSNEDYSFKVGDYNNQFVTRKKSDVLSDEEYKLHFVKNYDVEKILNKIFNDKRNLRLDCIIESTSGFGGKSAKISMKKTNCNQIEILRGRSIQKYEILQSFYFHFFPSNITGRTTDKNKLGYKEKVLLRKTGFPIVATYDDSGRFPEQSLYFLYNNKSSLSLKYLTAIINSKLFQFVYWNSLVTNRDSTPQLKKADLDRYPIRMLNLSDVSENKIHATIVSYVDQLLTAKKQLQQAKTESDKNYLQRKCETLDKQIDQLVYQLYGLTEEEIKIVEGN